MKTVQKTVRLQDFSWKIVISFILFNILYRFLGEIETDNLTVSNIGLGHRIFVK